MEKTLVILAAGMGSRFGGLKQITSIDENGEFIIDYSIYDAIRFNFNKIVLVIREENKDYFEKRIIKKYQDKIKIELAFQELPKSDKIPKDRVKMLGTAHALLCSQDKVNENFVVINADDFYGVDAYKQATEFFDKSTDPFEYLSVNYPFCATQSPYGQVKRGVVYAKNGYLEDLEESKIMIKDNLAWAESLETKKITKLPIDYPVSMNFLALKPSIFPLLEKELALFLQNKIDLEKELILTGVLKKYLKTGEIKIKCGICQSKWIGMTYREDLEFVKNSIKKLVELGEYPKHLEE